MTAVVTPIPTAPAHRSIDPAGLLRREDVFCTPRILVERSAEAGKPALPTRIRSRRERWRRPRPHNRDRSPLSRRGVSKTVRASPRNPPCSFSPFIRQRHLINATKFESGGYALRSIVAKRSTAPRRLSRWPRPRPRRRSDRSSRPRAHRRDAGCRDPARS